MGEGNAAPQSRLRRFVPVLLRLAVLAAIGVWLLRGSAPQEILAHLRSIPVWAVGASLTMMLLALAAAAFRWLLLMRALGAHQLPSVPVALRLFFIGTFYNTFVPGAVGGDLLRGVLTRRAFSTPAAAFVVVLLERLMGLVGLGVLLLLALMVGNALVDVRVIAPWIGITCAVGIAILIAGRLSGHLARAWSHVPRIHRPLDLIWAVVLSVGSHLLIIAGLVLFSSALALGVEVRDWLMVGPLSMIAAMLPIAVFGVGPREIALVTLLELAGATPEGAQALAAAAAGVVLSAALVGGIVQLITGRLSIDEDDAPGSGTGSAPG